MKISKGNEGEQNLLQSLQPTSVAAVDPVVAVPPRAIVCAAPEVALALVVSVAIALALEAGPSVHLGMENELGHAQ